MHRGVAGKHCSCENSHRQADEIIVEIVPLWENNGGGVWVVGCQENSSCKLEGFVRVCKVGCWIGVA